MEAVLAQQPHTNSRLHSPATRTTTAASPLMTTGNKVRPEARVASAH